MFCTKYNFICFNDEISDNFIINQLLHPKRDIFSRNGNNPLLLITKKPVTISDLRPNQLIVYLSKILEKVAYK